MAHPLADLYVLDQAIGRLDRRIAEHPRSLEELAAERASLEAGEEKRREELSELSRSIRRLEGEADQQREKIRQRKGKTFDIISVPASDALQHEIDTLEASVEALELEALEKLSALERMERETELRDPVQAGKLAELERERAGLERELEECRADRQRMAEQRQRFLEGMEPELRRRYERIHKAHGHTALAALHEGACGGCGAQLPPQKAIDVRRRGEILVCQGCGRLILGVEE